MVTGGCSRVINVSSNVTPREEEYRSSIVPEERSGDRRSVTLADARTAGREGTADSPHGLWALHHPFAE
jgi:hypothetical protein